MFNTNDKNLMTSAQVKKQLNSINTEKTDVKNSLLNIVEQFQCLDHIAKSVGLIKEGFSFVNRVSWKSVLSKLEQSVQSDDKNDIELNYIIEAISESSNQLEHELIPQLQKWRNKWMFEVMFIEFLFLSLLIFTIAGLTYLQGSWTMSNMNISFQPFIYERPVFSFVTGILVIICYLLMHFSIRNFSAYRLAEKLNKESSEFDFAKAFLKNTRIQHSIFRPDIIGWNWMTKKCLDKI